MHQINRWIAVGVGVLGVAMTAGCATGRRRQVEQVQLQQRLAAAELQLQTQHSRIEQLEDDLTVAQQSAPAAPPISAQVVSVSPPRSNMPPERQAPPSAAATPRPTREQIRRIQQALVNAGFDPGPVDGQMGRKTKRAIRSFQQAHRLKADGVAGEQTLAALQQYLPRNESAGMNYRK